MYLEARSPSCFSPTYVLKLDGKPKAYFHGRWFSEGMNIKGNQRNHFRFEKESVLGSHFTLRDHKQNTILAQADRAGWLTSAWDLHLSIGSCQLVSQGVFNSGFYITRQGRKVGTVEIIGMCEGGWIVRADDELIYEDLLFVGLIFHTILNRRRRRRNRSN